VPHASLPALTTWSHPVPPSPPRASPGSKCCVSEQIFFPGTDVVAQTIVRTEDEVRKIFKSCKLTLTDDSGKLQKPIPVLNWWLDSNERSMFHDIDFLTTPEVRAQPTLSRATAAIAAAAAATAAVVAAATAAMITAATRTTATTPAAVATADPSLAPLRSQLRAAFPLYLSTFTGLLLDESVRVEYLDASHHAGVLLILEHVLLLADGCVDIYNYVLDWLAFALQRRVKPGVMLVIIGASGVGKSFLFHPCGRNNPIMMAIYGGQVGSDNTPYMAVGDVSQLVKRFNLDQSNKLFCVSDEVCKNAFKQFGDELKYTASSERVTIEAKHLDASSMRAAGSYVLLSNHRASPAVHTPLATARR